MDNTTDLGVLLASRYPLLLVETQEEQRFLEILRAVARKGGMAVWTWSATRGLAVDGGDPIYLTTNPHQALAFVEDITAPAVFVFADAHPVLQDPLVVRRVKEAAQRLEGGQTLILTAPEHRLPPELAGLAHLWRLKPPTREELGALVKRMLDELAGRNFPVAIGPSHIDQIVESLTGLTIAEAARLVQQAAFADGQITPEDVSLIRAAKAELLNVDGVLELVESEVGTLDEVGGLDGLKRWLELRHQARSAGAELEAPRGLLLTGVPGCGKSLVAKTLARTWSLPLVLLDPSRLYSKYIGESEQRLDRALVTVEAMAPAVLWIDEIEKGFAASDGGDGGVSRRLLGTFLRWMQDRPEGVFLVATANDVASLPPELLRKGRFDEVFFVDLPGEEARTQILEIHLSRRGLDPAAFDLAKLTELSHGFSGAEIEAAVVGASYRAYKDEHSLDTESLAAEFHATVPLSVSRAEDVARLRAWAETRAVRA